MPSSNRFPLAGSFLLFILLLQAQATAWAVLIDDEEIPLHQVSAKECRLCHMEIYEQWKGSMHAQSTALEDPIHRAFYKKVVGDPTREGVKMKNGKYPICLKCHAPNAAQDKKTKLDAMPAYSEGVNCLVCHRLKKFKGTRLPNGKLRLGIDAYETAENCQGPSGFPTSFAEHAREANRQREGEEDKENPHRTRPFVSADDVEEMILPIESNPEMLKTSAACLGCHDKRFNSHGVPLCATGDEYVAGRTHVSCQSCHMPVTNGFANHSMGGGHDDAMLRRALMLKMDTRREGGQIKATVQIRNQQPHKVPTGAPFRNMILKVTAYDRDGHKLWENFGKHPLEEDPKSYFYYQLLDDSGKPVPPPKARKPGEDTRLDPYERRTLEYTIPAAKVAMIRAELYYNLLWPGLKKKFDFLPKHLKESKLMAFSEKHL